MKKLMFGMAAALALCGMADIESKNVVGYDTKESVDNKFYIVGIQFQGIDGSMKIDGLVEGTKGVDYDGDGAWMSTASQLQVPSAGGYTTYYYLNDGWYDNGTADGDYKPGWCDFRGEITADEFTPGVSVWFKSKTGDCTFTQAGQVPQEDTATVDCAASVFSLKANVFPVSFALNDALKASFEGIVGVDYDDGGAWMKTAPQIQIPSEGGYDTYYYLNDGWYDNGTADGDYKAGWCDFRGEIVDVTVPAGQGFWVKPVTGAFSIKFTK